MKNTPAVIMVPMVIILLLVELASAKPVDRSTDSNSKDATVSSSLDHRLDSAELGHNHVETSEFVDDHSPEYEKKIVNDLDIDESNRLTTTLLPVSGGTMSHEIPNLKPGFHEPSLLPAMSKPDHQKQNNNLAAISKPETSTATSLITAPTPNSGENNVNSLITSTEFASKQHNNLVTTVKSDNLSTTILSIASGESGTSATILESDSKRHKDLQSVTTSKPGFHDAGDGLPNGPVTKESKNRASDIGSSFAMIVLGIFFITWSHFV